MQAGVGYPCRFLFHLARTGGTLISRCLASMNGVCLLSEINPFGVSRFNPLRQAAEWHGLVHPSEITELQDGDFEAVGRAMSLISARAQDRGLALVIRDWSHLDWIGFPFVEKPLLAFCWERMHHFIAAPASLIGLEGGHTPVAVPELVVNTADARCATVRHPVDHYLSLRELTVLSDCWDERLVWRGIRRFAEAIQAMPWCRFEDFLAAPEATLEKICEALSLRYEPSWQQSWLRYTQITGDVLEPLKPAIAPQPRRPLAAGFWKTLRGNADFAATLDLLGYPTPEPLRRRWWTGPGEHAAPLTTCAIDKPPIRFTDWDSKLVQARQQFNEDGNDPAAALQLAESLRWTGQAGEAADLLLGLIGRRELPQPAQLTAVLSLACDCLEAADRKYESLPLRRLWLRHEPGHLGNLFQLSLLLAEIGEVEESLVYSRYLLELDRQNLGSAANFLLYLNYSDRVSATEIANEHFRAALRFTDQPDELVKRRILPGDKIRIGYLSSDFYTHPVGKIMLPILQSHNRQQFQIVAYHDGKRIDGNTAAMQQTVDQFITTHGWPDLRLLETIRRDGIDILIDLGGYTGGGNRLRVFSKRAAPVQASFLGYPNTSAIHTMDYHLTDRFADPPGTTEQLYNEQLVWLEHAHLAWQPYPIVEHVQVAPRGQPVVGLFNNVAKVSATAINTYAEILRRVPEARMVLKYGDRYQVPALQDRYRREFAARGVLPDRLEFRTRSESLLEHLTTMASVDLALDSFPYQGTMTSLECLAVGTPVLSCCGEYYARRATSAMMMRMRMHELVAGDPQEYAEIAVQLLGELQVLRSLRATVLQRFHEGPLTDPEGLTRELEAVFQRWVTS